MFTSETSWCNMSDYPMISPSPTSVVNDFSRGVTRENIVQNEPPSYESLNPSLLNNLNKIGPNQFQYQPQYGAPKNVVSTPILYSIPIMVNPALNQVENYKVWSILNIFFCCWILGCVACFYSVETDNARMRGDIQGAFNASRNARTINIISTVLGGILNVIFVLYYTGMFY